jgi:predicted alpha/beta-fold hydrolase
VTVSGFRPLFANAHLQTIAANFWPRKLDLLRYPVESRFFRTEPGVRVLVETQRPEGPPAGEIVLVHGLEGSGQSGYLRGMAQAGLEAGFLVHRFHMRTCGGAETLCPTLYHAGLTGDLLAFLREPQKQNRPPVYLVGFSLGGNVVLKLAGELGDRAAPLMAGVCAVSTPIDLAACARRIARWDNRLYERRFLKRMRARLRATGRLAAARRKYRSIYEFDDAVTGPSFGFRNAEHYYATQSSNQFLDRIRVPALLIQAKDDIFVPFETFDHPAFRSNPWLELVATSHGGHAGFIARGGPRFWLDRAVLAWIHSRNGALQSSTIALE